MFYEARFEPSKPEQPVLSEPAILLQLAADLLMEKGWCQHRATDEWGRMCTVGALRVAQGAFSTSAFHRAVILVRWQIGRDDIAHWNDTEGRTKEEVVDMLRMASCRSA